MTDFGVRLGAGGASAANQATQITAEEAIQAAAEALTKQAASTPVNAQVFDNNQAEYTSAEINTSGYRKFLLRVILAVTNSPTDIKINVQFSQGGATYENYMRGPCGSLMYGVLPAAIAECIEGECLGTKMKIYVKATDVDETKKFTLTCKVILTR